MFKRFFHKKKPARTFELLHDSPIKERYFIRTAQWDWLDHEHIAVVDPNSPRMLTMDPWPQWIFLDATGQSMIKEYVYEWNDKYKGALPAQLDKTILDTIQQLADYGIIQLATTPQTLDSRFELPLSAQENH